MRAPVFLSLFLIIAPLRFFGQGCSDAGICSLESFKHADADSASPSTNSISCGFSYGKGDHEVKISTVYLDYNRRFNAKTGINIKGNFISQSGSLTNNSGLADAYLTGRYYLKQSYISIGVKLPLNDANDMKDGQALPMDYQYSLGTVDILAGYTYAYRRWNYTFGFQFPVVQNKNTYLSVDHPPESIFGSFQSTNNYERSGDALLRITYSFQAGNKFVITPGLLPIYHIADDKYTDGEGDVMTITGSQGLTLNGTLFLTYQVNKMHSFELSLGSPFITRDARPDGLTRKYVAGLEYKISL